MENISQDKNVNKYFELLHVFFDLTEKKGLGTLKPHSSLFQGELITINATNEVNFGTDVPSKAEIKIFSNKTLFNLRVAVAKEFKTTWERVKLTKMGKEMKDSLNGRTLAELRLRSGETLCVKILLTKGK